MDVFSDLVEQYTLQDEGPWGGQVYRLLFNVHKAYEDYIEAISLRNLPTYQRNMEDVERSISDAKSAINAAIESAREEARWIDRVLSGRG